MPKYSSKILGAHSNFRVSWQLFKKNSTPLGWLLIITVLVDVLLKTLLSTNLAAVYQTLWLLVVSTALIWILRHLDGKKPVTLRQALYVGTAPIFKFLLIFTVVGLAALPLSVGGWIFSTLRFLAVETNLILDVLFGALYLSFAIISLLLLVRLLPALIIITLPDAMPVASMRASWKLTKGKTFTLSARWLVFSIYLLLSVVLISLLLSGVGASASISASIIGAYGVGIVLPLFYMYLWQIYKTLTK